VKYVLDTNVVVRLLCGDEHVMAHLSDVDPSDVGIPLLVVAELLFGAEKSARRDENQERVRRLTESLRMLPLNLPVVRRYAVVRAEVERRGRRKSDFDLMIACTALEDGATLVTHDAALLDGTIEGVVVMCGDKRLAGRGRRDGIEPPTRGFAIPEPRGVTSGNQARSAKRTGSL
jgi:tRNA(fMet)-specific endonuclease VapC